MVLVCAAGVLVSGAPGVAAAVGNLSEAQRLVELGNLHMDTVALSHSLADERDQMAWFVAAGRTPGGGAGITADQRARVDRQAAEVSRAAGAVDGADNPAVARHTGPVLRLLKTLPTVRRTALTGPGSAPAVFRAYSELIGALNTMAGAITRELPARALDQDTAALPSLTGAVEQASAQRGLLLIALTAKGGGGAGTIRAAQRALAGEQAALADFDNTASAGARRQYAETVTGKEVADAETLVRRLTDGGARTAADRRIKPADLNHSLTARIDRMRSVESSLAAATEDRLHALRDDDVVRLEINAALTALALLVVFGLTVRVSRSVVRPLARLRRAARELNGRLLPGLEASGGEVIAPKPVTVPGNDEFREIAAAITRLQEFAVRSHRERGSLAAENAALTGVRDALTAECDTLSRELDEGRTDRHTVLAGLSRRTLALVGQQLAVIERMEDHEEDPDRLPTLFRLDHLATRMRRNQENLLALAGAGDHRPARAPVLLIDVMRAAVSETEQYERIHLRYLPRALVAGGLAADVSHLVAELLENATAFSPEHTPVEVSGRELDNGAVMLCIEDGGSGIPAERLTELNGLLADPGSHTDEAARCLGLFVAGTLAGRHGISVELRTMPRGGVTAAVTLPPALFVPMDTAAGPRPVTMSGQSASGQSALPDLPSPAAGAPAACGTVPPATPDEHARPDADTSPAPARPKDSEQPPATAAPGAATTDRGLPKRVPMTNAVSGAAGQGPAAPGDGTAAIRARARGTAAGGPGTVDAAELRRRLGGFQEGLREGRRQAEELFTSPLTSPTPPTPSTSDDGEAPG